MRFAGKVAVVTGAASGIGKAAVLKLAGEGAHVFAADIDEAGGKALAEASNGKIEFLRCDVTVAADIEALMNEAAKRGGGIDIVFNNAAAGGHRAQKGVVCGKRGSGGVDRVGVRAIKQKKLK